LFPPEYVQEFQNCFDRAPAVPFEDIQSILQRELGRPIDSVYEYVDSTPIASASIAQVDIFFPHSFASLNNIFLTDLD
jgi:aarF domain-containing kinase